MRTQLFRPLVVLALVLCIAAASAKSTSAATARNKGIDATLLAKANAGEADAQYRLGNMYNFGDGVRRDYAQALVWYRKGAEQGDAKSEFQLGGLYHFGHGVPQDDAQGFAWTMKAAEQGDGDADSSFPRVTAKAGALQRTTRRKWPGFAREQSRDTSTRNFFLGGRMRPASMVSLWTTRKPISGWTLLHRERSHVKSGKRLSRGAMKPPSHLTPAELSHVQERVQQWVKDHPAQSQ